MAVAKINESPVVLITRSDRPYKSLKEMVEWAKANPGKLINGSTVRMGDVSSFVRFYALP